jgi:hypothetical protein
MSEEIKLHHYPEPVGYWQITPDIEGGWNTRFAVYKKPEEDHITNTEKLLGWKWVDV